MAWQTVKVDNSKICRGKPTASVGRNKISLNVAACELIEKYDEYKYVEFLIDDEKPSEVGVRFLKEATPNSIIIKRKMQKGKIVGGIDVSSKLHMEKIFGIKGVQDGTTHYDVVKDSDYENILVVLVKG